MTTTYTLSGYIVEEQLELTLEELCQTCGVDAEWLKLLMEEGILDPHDHQPQIRFSGVCIQRVRIVQRLQQDLGVNLPGAALALELMQEIDALQARLAALDPVKED